MRPPWRFGLETHALARMSSDRDTGSWDTANSPPPPSEVPRSCHALRRLPIPLPRPAPRRWRPLPRGTSPYLRRSLRRADFSVELSRRLQRSAQGPSMTTRSRHDPPASSTDGSSRDRGTPGSSTPGCRQDGWHPARTALERGEFQIIQSCFSRSLPHSRLPHFHFGDPTIGLLRQADLGAVA
jgi:hypothetical protein